MNVQLGETEEKETKLSQFYSYDQYLDQELKHYQLPRIPLHASSHCDFRGHHYSDFQEHRFVFPTFEHFMNGIIQYKLFCFGFF